MTEKPKTRPAQLPPYGGAQLPAEAAPFMDWARELLAGRGADWAVRYASGYMAGIVADAMRHRTPHPDNAARAFALYIVSGEIDLQPEQAPQIGTPEYGCCGGSGLADFAAVPCPNPDCPTRATGGAQ